MSQSLMTTCKYIHSLAHHLQGVTGDDIMSLQYITAKPVDRYDR